jgi:hypothetical protein
MTTGVLLWVVGLVVAYLIGVFSNLTTPAIGNWIASWSQRSLAKRIALLEGRLAVLEGEPTITDAEEQILWGITSTQMDILNACNFVALVAFLTATALTNDDHKLKVLAVTLTVLFIGNIFFIMRRRYAHNFRYKHSPSRKAELKKAIADLKTLQLPPVSPGTS